MQISPPSFAGNYALPADNEIMNVQTTTLGIERNIAGTVIAKASRRAASACSSRKSLAETTQKPCNTGTSPAKSATWSVENHTDSAQKPYRFIQFLCGSGASVLHQVGRALERDGIFFRRVEVDFERNSGRNVAGVNFAYGPAQAAPNDLVVVDLNWNSTAGLRCR